MKKVVVLTIILLTMCIYHPAQAYMVTFGMDSSLSLSAISGFEFDVAGVTIGQISFDVMYQSEGGGVPNEIITNIPWEVRETTDGVYGYSNSSGSYPLTAGTIVTLSAASPFTLANFLLADINEPSGSYPYDFSVVSSDVVGGASYTLTAVVPIPASALLLGSGLLGVFGIRRKR